MIIFVWRELYNVVFFFSILKVKEYYERLKVKIILIYFKYFLEVVGFFKVWDDDGLVILEFYNFLN